MIDMHVHFFPPGVFRAIWRFFEENGNGLWTVKHKIEGDELISTLKRHGVARFPTLVYAHKPGLAPVLNDFVAEWAARTPEILPFGTLFAGDGNVKQESRRIFEKLGFFGIKLHPFVSREQLDDERLFEAYELMEAQAKVLICHPASGPGYTEHNGAEHLARVLKRFPELKVVVAHCGAFEYGDYCTLADRYQHVYFDTAMNCVHHDAFPHNCPGREFFTRYEDRVLYGSDFPNIPYDYELQVAGLRAMHLGAQAEEKILSLNARRLVGF